ncbi:hypothetical protein TCAL_04760 [Tigriopus californicus]|uniref:Ig-like domain-containing protein n=2 Tax=Tigriopus californicus TaxID=6832 RepID=A0A553P454_TIGCA|nr:hypothetical protein TCAL_04760 [Tigriopus californicus]
MCDITYDLRGRAPNQAQHWADAHVLGNRANFYLSRPVDQWDNNGLLTRNPGDKRRPIEDRLPVGTSVLTIRGISTQDRGLYRCRVDFHAAPTRNSMANLTVVVPPKVPVIVDETGHEAESYIGPYVEEASIPVACEVRGGSPKPEIQWYRSGLIILGASEISSGSTVTSTITLSDLKRIDDGALLTCEASNNNISRPVRRSVAIVMNLPPTAVWIQRKDRHLMAGKEVNFQCSSSGSTPRTRFKWLLDSEPLNQAAISSSSTSTTTTTTNAPLSNHTQEMVAKTTLSFPGGTKGTSTTTQVFRQSNLIHQPLNANVSVISYIPLISDHGKELRCLVDNPGLKDSTIEDSLILEIHYPPMLSLTHGSNLDLSTIKEGDDVYFECQVQARPAIDKITWYLNENVLHQDLDGGIIIANRTLVLQKVRRIHSGFYTCRAKNVEGQASSNKVGLNVKYSPVCSHSEPNMFGVAAMENMNLVCDVNAFPKDLTFHWRFNNSGDEEFDLDNFMSNGTRSILTFSPMTKRDYGTILCFANNEVGRQRKACLFQIVPAGPPHQPTNCSQYNHSSDAIQISCLPAYDGGMEQIFTLELIEQGNRQLVRNLTLAFPAFVITRLESAAIFDARIFASNQKGRSEPIELKASTLKRPSEKRLATTASGGNGGPGGQHLSTGGVLVREESSSDEEALSSVHAGTSITHESSHLIFSWPTKTILIIIVSSLTLSLIVVVIIGVICRIQCRMTTHAGARMTTSSSSQEILAGKSSIVGASSSSLLLSQHHGRERLQEGPGQEDSDLELPINGSKNPPPNSEYLLHDNFLEPMAGEILPLPSGTPMDPKQGHGSLQRPPNLRGHPHSQVYSEYFGRRMPSSFKTSGNHNSTFAGDNMTPPLPPPGASVGSGASPGPGEGGRSLHFHGQPHPGSILNPSQLQHSCTHSFVPSQPATSMANPPRERRGSSSEILTSLACSNNTMGVPGSSPQPSNFMPPPMGDISSSSYIHTFPRQHRLPDPNHGNGNSLASVLTAPSGTFPSVPNSRSMNHGFDAVGTLTKKGGERRKTVTFLGDVTTIHPTGGDQLRLGPPQSSIMGEDPRTLLSPGSTATSSEGDEYVESRV